MKGGTEETINVFYDSRRFRSLKPALVPGGLSDYSQWLVGNLAGERQDILNSLNNCKSGTDFNSINNDLAWQRLRKEVWPSRAQWPKLVRKALVSYLDNVVKMLQYKEDASGEQSFGSTLLVVSLNDLLPKLKKDADDPDHETSYEDLAIAVAVFKAINTTGARDFNQRRACDDCAELVKTLVGSERDFYLRESERFMDLLFKVAQE